MTGTPPRHQPAAALRDLIRAGEARRLREAAGISTATMGAGLGITRKAFWAVETGHFAAGPALAARYLRVLRALANHDEVSRELARDTEQAA